MIESYRNWKFLLGVIVAFALAVRLLGINFGLPLHLHPDEWSQVDTARAMLGGDLNPHFFRYSSLTIYQLFVLDGALTLAQHGGVLVSTATFYLTGRLLSAVYGAATVVVVFWLGTLIRNRTTGLVAALLFSVSAAAVEQAHYATVDTALVFWMMLSLALGLWAFRQPTRSWLPAAVSAGLAIGTKYPGVVILFPLFLLLLWRMTKFPFDETARVGGRAWAAGISIVGGGILLCLLTIPPAPLLSLARAWTTDGDLNIEYINLIDSFWRLGQILGLGLFAFGLALFFLEKFRRATFGFARTELLCFTLVVAATFLITSPFVLLDLPAAARDIFFEYRHMQLGNAADYALTDPIYSSLLPTSFFPDPLYYWRWFLDTNGWLVVVASAIGVFSLARQNIPAFAATALLFLITLFGITHGANKADRYALPLLPLLFLWAAVGIETVAAMFASRWHTASKIALVGIVILFPVLATRAMLINTFLLPDTRTLAWQWIDAHLPFDATVLREDYTPDLEHVAPRMAVQPTASAFQTLSYAELQRREIHYLIIGKNRDWYTEKRALYPTIANEYSKLQENGILLAQFTAVPNESIGPPIWIYRVP